MREEKGAAPKTPFTPPGAEGTTRKDAARRGGGGSSPSPEGIVAAEVAGQTPHASEDLAERTVFRQDDSLWKDLLSRFFVPMLRSVLPDLASDLDPTRPVTFLDKELRRLARFTRKAEGGDPDSNRYVDLLADVPLAGGESAWILLHAEVQGRGGNENFPLRMHRYRGLLEGRYRRPVVGLAFLIEPLPPSQSQGCYLWERYGTRVLYEFPVVKIFEGDEEQLKSSDNPFDLAHLAGLRAWKSRGNEARKLDYLKEMLLLLDDRGWSHDEKAQLLVFMEGVIHITDDESSREYEEWEEELERDKEARRMYVSISERKGIKKGMEKGSERARVQMARRMLARGMDVATVADLTELPESRVCALAEGRE